MSHAASQRHDPGRVVQDDERRGANRPWSARAATEAPAAGELERALELASFIESASDAVVAISPAGLLTNWSDGAERLFGYTRSEIVGQSVLVLSPRDGEQEARELLERVQAGARVEQAETERVAKDGRLLKLRISISPVWSNRGEFAGAVGIYGDLSEQRRTEEALRASERRYHSVVDALSEGIVMRDASGRVVASNKSAERILGRSAKELTETTLVQPLLSFFHEDRSPFLAHEQPALLTRDSGEPESDVIMGVEDPTGAVRWLSVNSCALKGPEEHGPYACVTSFTDITELRETLAELRAARLADLKRLALMGEYRDEDTNWHTERVGRTAELLALTLGLGNDFSSTVSSAAPLHDVGKIGISDSILLKPGKLTAEEFAVIKTHTLIGARILSDSSFPILQMASEIALTHHERWDGSGYPLGLCERAIPVAGRIVAVADAFDAMTHARPYKGALSVEHAVQEISRCSAGQFDPEVVDAFMTLDHQQLVECG